MDLLETIVEERNQIRECLTSYNENLKQYQEYLSQLKDNLDETQLCKSQTTETLEINNLTKEVFNEDYKEVKLLIGKIYSYVQQIGENLATVTHSESAVEDLFNENAERLKRIESNILNNIQILEMIKKGNENRVTVDHNTTQEEINLIDEEYRKCEQIWKNALDEYEEQQKILDSIKIESEILDDDIDNEIKQQEAFAQETKESGRLILNELRSNMELNDRILEAENNILEMSQKLKEILVNKEEMSQRQKERQSALQHLDKECKDYETKIDKYKIDNTKRLEIIRKDIEEKEILLEESKGKLATSQKKTDEMNKIIEEFNSKIGALDEELSTLRQNAVEDDDYIEKNRLEEISLETERLRKESENLQKLIFESKNEANRYQTELNQIKSTPNLELEEYKKKMKALELERMNTVNLEKKIEEIDKENKSLQQSVERHQTAIKDYSSQKIQIHLELEVNHKELKNLTIQCDNIEKEILRLEAAKREKIKLFPKPPLKRTPAMKRNSTRKRSIAIDAESDSSIDGERLSYAEFMAKKRIMKEKKLK